MLFRYTEPKRRVAITYFGTVFPHQFVVQSGFPGLEYSIRNSLATPKLTEKAKPRRERILFAFTIYEISGFKMPR